MAANITTIKLSKDTKGIIDKLKVYRRETYDEVLQEMLSILNLCKVNSEAARRRLLVIDKRGKLEKKKSFSEEFKNKFAEELGNTKQNKNVQQIKNEGKKN